MLCSPLLATQVQARPDNQPTTEPEAATDDHLPVYASGHWTYRNGVAFYQTRHLMYHGGPANHLDTRRGAPLPTYGISCVPYAREVSGIRVAGNAWQWWENAASEYARGNLPEAGSVLTFRSNGRMRLGHVAVVTRVVNPREVVVDHANWPGIGMRGGVTRNVAVVDVSEANNWSAVRVGLARSGDFGSVYPTYGFIYNRPATGRMLASTERRTPRLAPPAVRAERGWRTYEEVAETPSRRPQRLDLSVAPTSGN